MGDEHRKLSSRVDSIVSRAVVERVDDSKKTQRLQVTILEGEVEGDVENVQPYGVSFTPPSGAEATCFAVGGYRAHTVAMCSGLPGDRPVSSTENTGGLYTSGTWRVYIDGSGIVHLGAKSAAQFVAQAQKVLDELNLVKADLAAMKVVFDAHTHITTATIGLGGPGVNAPPAVGFATPHTPSSVAATKAKCT